MLTNNVTVIFFYRKFDEKIVSDFPHNAIICNLGTYTSFVSTIIPDRHMFEFLQLHALRVIRVHPNIQSLQIR